jgi:hypothetical protein
VRAPEQCADLDAAARQIAEHVPDLVAVLGEALIGVPPPVREEDPVTGAQRAQLLVEAAEVHRAVHERGHRVTGGPRTALAARTVVGRRVEVGVGVAALGRAEEPPVRRVVAHTRGLPPE